MHMIQPNIPSLSLVARVYMKVLVNWDKWEGYHYGSRTLIQLSEVYGKSSANFPGN